MNPLYVDQTLTSLEDIAFRDAVAPVPGLPRTSQAERVPTHARNLLALDLGTHTGWALRRCDGSVSHGTEKFANLRRAHAGQRWANFRAWLVTLIHREHVHAIAYEDVKRHVGTDAAHAYGAFRALLELAAASQNIELLPVGVGTIKKAWTGTGRADKQAMLIEARRRGFRPDTDNAADALAVLSWASAREES